MKSSDDSRSWSIGEVAERFGIATHVLRHWETVGLLHPAREGGSRRRYEKSDVYAVAMILRAKEAGFGLDDIREMFDTDDPVRRTAILGRHRDALARRIARLCARLRSRRHRVLSALSRGDRSPDRRTRPAMTSVSGQVHRPTGGVMIVQR
ncbi:helix-turn-helix domain-containing protein [Rhodococcus opacus]|uniref:helix-turn-helix domain-containing protein n=1 Tax=Rhodococcus opacus TaxID=37919 RepID=UPI001CED5E7D|nr:MerR family transcriptional regulator [Rhodococcus opacus]